MRVSVILQYFKSSYYIPILTQWKKCAGVELLVNIDSKESKDLLWLNSTADTLVFSNNIHELRAYNQLSFLAKAPIIMFVQDDMAPPLSCEYIDHMESILQGKNAIVGWRTFSLGPLNEYHRRITAKKRWYNDTFNAQYCSLVDVGPMAFQKKIFHHLQGFDPGWSDVGKSAVYFDVEISMRFATHGWNVVFYHAAYNLCFYCWSKMSAVQKKNMRLKANYEDKTNEIAKYRKHTFRKLNKQLYYLSHNVSILNSQLLRPYKIKKNKSCCNPWGLK
tara:strand:+ start:8196 stop:9023 length:828 start_codon:yes stop_codon:yes gene_type:complete